MSLPGIKHWTKTAYRKTQGGRMHLTKGEDVRMYTSEDINIESYARSRKYLMFEYVLEEIIKMKNQRADDKIIVCTEEKIGKRK